MKADEIKLGYLLIASPVPNTFIGGLMVTDHRAMPLEFRYTEPIQPTKIQQVLYGQVLSAYIKREVILETLLKNLDVKLSCLLVEDESLLDYPAKGYSLLRLTSTKSGPSIPVGQIQTIAPDEVLIQLTAESSPIRVFASKTAKASGPEKASFENDLALLFTVGESMDICEPPRRVEKALEIICQEAGITSNASTAT